MYRNVTAQTLVTRRCRARLDPEVCSSEQEGYLKDETAHSSGLELINVWRIATGMPENPPRSHACSSPRKSMRLAAGAVVAFFWEGWPRRPGPLTAEVPVIAARRRPWSRPSVNVVSLAPQVETVYQTVYETVYDNEPVTVMETRYRMAYRTENYTVMRPVTETSYVERPYTVTKPVYQTVNQERRYTVMKPVYQTERRERRYTVHEAGLPDGQPRAALHRHEAGREDRADGAAVHRHEAGLPDVNQERRYTVMKPVYQTEHRERRYTVMKPVYQTVNQERRYTVMKPVYETVDGRAAVHGLPAGDDRSPGASSAAITSGSTPRFPARSSSERSACRSRNATSASPLRALQLLPPQEESHRDRRRPVPAADGQPARLRVAAGGPRRQRDPLRPRDDGPPGARDRPAATWPRSGSRRSP